MIDCVFGNLECPYAVVDSSLSVFCSAPDVSPDYCPSFDFFIDDGQNEFF